MMKLPMVLACLATHPARPSSSKTLNTNENVATSLSFSKAPLPLYLSLFDMVDIHTYDFICCTCNDKYT